MRRMVNKEPTSGQWSIVLSNLDPSEHCSTIFRGQPYTNLIGGRC